MGQGVDLGGMGVFRVSCHCLSQAIPITLGYMLYSEPAVAVFLRKGIPCLCTPNDTGDELGLNLATVFVLLCYVGTGITGIIEWH